MSLATYFFFPFLIIQFIRMRKVLLFGATGMAGHVVYHYLHNTGRYEIVNVVYRTPLTADSIVLDVRDTNAVAETVAKVKPNIIINCIPTERATIYFSPKRPIKNILKASITISNSEFAPEGRAMRKIFRSFCGYV